MQWKFNGCSGQDPNFHVKGPGPATTTLFVLPNSLPKWNSFLRVSLQLPSCWEGLQFYGSSPKTVL